MRCAGRIQGEKLAGRMRSALGISYTSGANRTGCTQPVYSSTYSWDARGEKQSWWISTTAHGDFQPKKTLRQTAAVAGESICVRLGQPGRIVSLAGIKCL